MKRRKFHDDEAADSSSASSLLQQQQGKEGGESSSAGEGSSSPKKENQMISLKQACIICERLLKEQEETLCEDYEKALIEKLSEQYSAYIKFSQDQLQSNNIDHSESYIS